jgi:hypothetical protein
MGLVPVEVLFVRLLASDSGTKKQKTVRAEAAQPKQAHMPASRTTDHVSIPCVSNSGGGMKRYGQCKREERGLKNTEQEREGRKEKALFGPGAAS